MSKQRSQNGPEGNNGGSADLERYLLNLLSRGILPTAKVREKLAARGASPEEAEDLVLRFSDAGYLDDGAYAVLFADSHHDWGPLRLKDELRRRGVAPSFIREALSDVDEEARAAVLAEEWSAGGLEGKKIVGRLLRRGFSFSVCRKVAERACEGEG
ncbi:Regulatory protein RecX [bioreactor metagenome]|uniref:Regulatory protein RecX n=1 Tax=bioreactor metagenome TaxID=1076179 RepID=A0A644XFE4_9ZZZZ|nr:regulatory protein RecX [Aminivibrio sp.]MDD3515279.1 regulatory protein RecX [Synergistaceae bacterium]MEA4953560.1 regulatory protein RecX [Aminivibrio sp.]NCB14906.1 regulatory protein RecX [Synergistales bacterium]HPF85773.1 regulatory protein RecX [Aminivibrio sp.]